MNIVKRAFVWVIIPILIMMGILYYINDFYLTTSGTFQIKKLTSENDTLKNTIGLDVPNGATDIKASYDGSYVSYILNGELFIMDTKTQNIKKTITSNSGVYSYVWLNDRNRLIYFYRTYHNGTEAIQLEAYDLDINKNVKIDKLIYAPRNSRIKNITLSPLTSMIYVNIVDNAGYSYLYRIDIMGQIVNLKLPIRNIARMYELQNTDTLIYESSNDMIRVIKNGNGYTFTDSGYSLIGTDNKDNVYIGKLRNSKVVEIYYGQLNKKLSTWNHIKLNHAVSTDDIKIFPKDNSINVTFNGRDLINISSGNTISGAGKIIGVNSNYIIYFENNKVTLKLQ